MSDRIEVKKEWKKGVKHYYLVEEVQCPKVGTARAAQRCKQCQHCRIYLGAYIKCTYADDKRRAELHPENII